MDQVTSISAFLIVMMTLLPVTSRLLNRYPRQRSIGKASLLGVYLFVNMYLTVLSRGSTVARTAKWIPFWSYIEVAKGDQWTGIQIILNILLYIPMGYLLHFTFPRLKPLQVILIGCLSSILTETAQYIFKLGLCEFDDVFHNTLGTIVGVGAYWGMKKVICVIGYWLKRKQAKSRFDRRRQWKQKK